MIELSTPQVGHRLEDGHELSMLWWRAPEELRAVSTAVLGGGIGPCRWFLNAQVHADYRRVDVAAHLSELAASAGLDGPGAGMLTAVDVTHTEVEHDDGVAVLATVGLGWPTWAAAPDRAAGDDAPTAASERPPIGTINLFVVIPAVLSDAALVNVLATVTEAKVQALLEGGVAGTGTASDAVCVAARLSPAASHVDPPGDAAMLFGGPRSQWGSRAARATYAAVRRGAAADRDRALANGWPR